MEKNLQINLADASVGKKNEHFSSVNQSTTQNHQVKRVSFMRNAKGDGEIIVDVSDPSMGIDVKQQDDALLNSI